MFLNQISFFLSALVFGKKAPILIDEEMVKTMKPGSYIIDVSIDQGGNCSLTKAGEELTLMVFLLMAQRIFLV